MKTYKFINVITSVMLFSCNSIHMSNKQRDTNTIKFELNYYLKHKVNNVATDTLKNGQIITLTEDEKSYYERVRKINSPYSSFFSFYKHNQHLETSVDLFYQNPIGLYKKYEKNGNLISQENCDSLYKFSFKNLVDLVRSKFNLDITNTIKIISVFRYIDEKTYMPKYEIRIPEHDVQDFKYIVINGNTGEIITNTIGHYVE